MMNIRNIIENGWEVEKILDNKDWENDDLDELVVYLRQAHEDRKYLLKYITNSNENLDLLLKSRDERIEALEHRVSYLEAFYNDKIK